MLSEVNVNHYFRRNELHFCFVIALLLLMFAGHSWWTKRHLSLPLVAIPVGFFLLTALKLMLPRASTSALSSWCYCVMGVMFLIEWKSANAGPFILTFGLILFGMALSQAAQPSSVMEDGDYKAMLARFAAELKPETLEQVRDLRDQGRLIPAIRLVRVELDLGLGEARDLVQSLKV